MSLAARMALVARLGTLVGMAVLLAACAGSNASVAPPTPVPSGVVAVEAKDYAFTPSTISVPAGSVTFSVRNVGGQEHEFEVLSGETVVDKITGISTGATVDRTLTLVAGAYTFICKLNGHDQLGMKGTLTVTGG